MLKFFFNKESKIVYSMEAVGVLCLITLIVTWWPSGKSAIAKFAFFLFVIEYLFIRACSTASWYDKEGQNRFFILQRTMNPSTMLRASDERRVTGYEGIELHFKKAVVPTSYIIAIFSTLLLAGTPAFILYIADILLAIIAHVNVILIYFHIKDHESLPVNYFTHNKHL